MKYNSALLTEGRNKLGDTVWARNPSGNYIRARVKPTNPQTPAQTARRTVFSTLTKSWRTLTTSQIIAWNALAQHTTIQDKLGQAIRPSGLQLYMRCNINLSLVGLGTITDAPQNNTIPPLPTLTIKEVDVDPGVAWVGGGDTIPAPDPNPYAPIGYYTRTFSPGISFVPPFMFIIAPFVRWDPDFGDNFTLGSEDPDGYFPTPGGKIAIGWRLVDQTTGFASQMAYGTTTNIVGP